MAELPLTRLTDDRGNSYYVTSKTVEGITRHRVHMLRRYTRIPVPVVDDGEAPSIRWRDRRSEADSDLLAYGMAHKLRVLD